MIRHQCNFDPKQCARWEDITANQVISEDITDLIKSNMTADVEDLQKLKSEIVTQRTKSYILKTIVVNRPYTFQVPLTSHFVKVF